MQYSKDQLYEMNIHVLRNIAREVGVKAPTSFKKAALINEISQINSGKKQPCAPSNKGRPPKNSAEHKYIAMQNTFVDTSSFGLEENIKKQFIASILKEIEKKLNKLL